MSVQFSVTFSSLLVEYEHFLALHDGACDFANNLSAFYCRSTYGHGTFFVYQQHFLVLYSCAGFCLCDVMYKQFLALFGFELLSVNFYNYVHFSFYN